MALTAEQRAAVKAQGFLSNRDGQHFSARIITENGVLSARQLQNLSEAAQTYGNGQVAFTSRMTVELPGIKFEDIPAFQEYVGREGMVTGGTGAKVRPVVSCKGTVCVFGQLDTQALATKVHHRFFEGYAKVSLPHKFKIAVGGCPNNCVKPDLNDFGIVGQRVPNFQKELCRGCKKCGVELACPMGAAAVKGELLSIDEKVCNNCGRCIGQCYFGAIADGKQACRIYVGGRWGKQTRMGTLLPGVYTQEQAMELLEKSILLFRERGYQGERFGSMIDRIGEQTVLNELLNGDLLSRREEILAAPTAPKAETISIPTKKLKSPAKPGA